MYTRARKGWKKHIDFFLLDVLMLEISLVLSYWIRHLGSMRLRTRKSSAAMARTCRTTSSETSQVTLECFGTEYQPLEFIEQYVRDTYDLTPKGIIQSLGLLDVDYNKVSAYGHFGKAGLPWEE